MFVEDFLTVEDVVNSFIQQTTTEILNIAAAAPVITSSYAQDPIPSLAIFSSEH